MHIQLIRIYILLELVKDYPDIFAGGFATIN